MVITKLLSSSRERLVNLLKNFSYRHSWVEAHVTNGIAFQLRAMRKGRQWDQEKLAELALGNPKLQSMISRYENPDYGKYSLSTLFDFARAFDVALEVKFAPFSDIIKWEEDLPTIGGLDVPSFETELVSGALRSVQITTTTPQLGVPIAAGSTRAYQSFWRRSSEYDRPAPGIGIGHLMRTPVPSQNVRPQVGGTTNVQ